MEMPELRHYSDAIRLVCGRAVLRASDDDWAGAIQDFELANRLAKQFQESPLFAGLSMRYARMIRPAIAVCLVHGQDPNRHLDELRKVITPSKADFLADISGYVMVLDEMLGEHGEGLTYSEFERPADGGVRRWLDIVPAGVSPNTAANAYRAAYLEQMIQIATFMKDGAPFTYEDLLPGLRGEFRNLPYSPDPWLLIVANNNVNYKIHVVFFAAYAQWIKDRSAMFTIESLGLTPDMTTDPYTKKPFILRVTPESLTVISPGRDRVLQPDQRNWGDDEFVAYPYLQRNSKPVPALK
jgi:hypothetical protein